ncbi:unnamed protein product [Paramecium primaurelia]|uniref:TRAFD1/XAF1 zinc finger domain-containing protein n=1 Tax=Paramecium primaurelia TaxID=5886 RepID=A0A8S1LPM9_PARPR|nr:unnamed protein product [Paramecium primaurelia]
MAICQFCRKQIDEDKIMLHEMYCERNCIKCNRCGLMYDQNDPESHEEEFHKLHQCPHCKHEFQDLNKHYCQETPIQCQYCQLEISIKSFSQHEIQCGSRTEMCNSCKQYIKKSDLNIHQEICLQKKFDKLGRGEILNDFPSLQEVKQTYVSPKLDQQNKEKQVQQKQNNLNIQTQQPIEFNNPPVKSQKIDYPNDQQQRMQEKRGDYNKDIQPNYKKEVNQPNYNNQVNQLSDKILNKEFNNDPKYNQGLRSTQQTQEFKQKSDKIQIHEVEQQYDNRPINNYKYKIEEKYENNNNNKQLQDYKVNQRPLINNTQEISSQNDQRSNQYPQYIKQTSNPSYDQQFQQNQIRSTQPKYSSTYLQDRNIQGIQDNRQLPNNNLYNTDIQSKNRQGQKYSTNITQDITKSYQPSKQSEYGLPQNYYQNNKNTNQYQQDNKYQNPQTQQQYRPEIGLNDRDYKQTNNYRGGPVVSKPLDNQERKTDKMQFAPIQSEQPNQFQLSRNPYAYQEVKYKNLSTSQPQHQQYQQKQQEYQPKQYQNSKQSPIETQKQSQNQYQPQELKKKQDFQTKYNDYNQYEYSKKLDDKQPQNIPQNLESNDSVIARKLQEQIYADDLQMTPQQIKEQQELYKMLEENAKKQQSTQNRTYQYYEETREPNQSNLLNGFEFLSEDEKQYQKQILESLELQKQKRW